MASDSRGSRRTRSGLPFLMAALIAVVSLWPRSGRGEIEITLRNEFIERMKDRATISADYTVDKAHARPNPPKQDGDLHIAGRSAQIELPVVAEIMNAASERPSVDLIHEKEGTGETVNIVGAWRIWTEHGGNSVQVQGDKLDPFTTTNPPHVFQIHPVVKLESFNLAKSLRPVVGFRNKDAHDAFRAYENIRSHLSADQSTTKIVTTMGGYNYVEFLLEPMEAPFQLEDGHAVEAHVYTLDNELLVHRRRMVFVQGTPPERALLSRRRGKTLHVVGVPRIDLKLVSWRTRNAQARPEVLTWNLPYEIVVVGVYGPR